MTLDWTQRYADRVQRERSDAITEILKLTQQPEMISFAGGLPAAELFPREAVLAATQRVLEGSQANLALQYSIAAGYPPLREMIAAELVDVPATIDNVLIVSGSQQGIDLVGKVLINPGDVVAVEQPTYLGVIQTWQMYGAAFQSVETDDEGMLPDSLREVLSGGAIKLIYLVSNFQNPTGCTTSLERRQQIVALAREYDVLILEDDPYGKLRYEGQELPSLLAVDHTMNPPGNSAESLTSGNVIQLGTFSKTLCPGFRVAWMAGPADVMTRFSNIKEDGDLHTSTFAQLVTYETARDGFIDVHRKILLSVYQERRDTMLGYMDKLFPAELSWTHPEGGLFTWVTLPESWDSAQLLRQAVQQKVAFVPGAPFFPNGGGHNTLRLNYSNAVPEQIEVGITRLAEVIGSVVEKAV